MRTHDRRLARKLAHHIAREYRRRRGSFTDFQRMIGDMHVAMLCADGEAPAAADVVAMLRAEGRRVDIGAVRRALRQLRAEVRALPVEMVPGGRLGSVAA